MEERNTHDLSELHEKRSTSVASLHFVPFCRHYYLPPLSKYVKNWIYGKSQFGMHQEALCLRFKTRGMETGLGNNLNFDV